jgi:segregation and condensation protein B
MATPKTREELDREINAASEFAEDATQADSESRAEVSADESADARGCEGAAQSIEADSVAKAVSDDQTATDQAADPALVARLKMVMESVLFVSGNPVGFATLIEVARAVQPNLSARSVRELLEQLREKLREEGRGIRLVEVAGGYQLRTPSECAPFLRNMVTRRPPRMTRATLETLAMVAYRQPITRAEIEELRGVDCGPVLRHLLEKKLVRILGRKEEPGRPLMYGTTKDFLSLFSLKDLSSLPTLKDFVELSDEHRASLGLEARSNPDKVEEKAVTTDADMLRLEDVNAFTPVGNDEVIQELAYVLDEMRVRNRQVRELFPASGEHEEPDLPMDAKGEIGTELEAEHHDNKSDDPEGAQ